MWNEVLKMPDPVEVDYSSVEELFCQRKKVVEAVPEKKKKTPTEVSEMNANFLN